MSIVEDQVAQDTAKVNRQDDDYWLKHSRSGGAYIPPQRLAMMQQELPDQVTEAYQRLSWEALRKSLNGLINKVNVSNIKEIIVELFGENLVRGRGILVKSVMKAQAAALPFTAVYSAMLAVLNTKLPMIGELLLIRLIHQFRKSYRRNDKVQCLASVTFLAHLVNQRVAHEIVALQILTLLLERPTDDSVEIAVGFMRECGLALGEISPKPSNAIFERFRAVLHEGRIDKRVQYMIEVLFQLRKDQFKGHEAIKAELDLVAEEDQITHYVSLDDEVDPQEGLNIFKYDPDFLEKEEKYNVIKDEILGDEASEEEEEVGPIEESSAKVDIHDETSTDLINLRKTIYLTVMSSVDFEECGHKLLKLDIPEGLEIELCNMIVECCSQERTYLKFFGLLAERFCQLDPMWQENFESCLDRVYSTVHRLETNRIRNVCKLFGHLLHSEAISWGVLACIRLTEEDTTSASRIFIKFLFLELAELYGIPKLRTRLLDPVMKEKYFTGLFPTETLRECRFAINYWTAIGLGPLTDELREFLTAAMELEEQQHQCQQQHIVEDERGRSRSRDSHDSYASSPESYRRESRTPIRIRSPSPHRRSSPSHQRSPSPHRRHSRSPRRHHYRSRSPRSRSPRHRHRSRSRSPHRHHYRSRSRSHHRHHDTRHRSRSRHRE